MISNWVRPLLPSGELILNRGLEIYGPVLRDDAAVIAANPRTSKSIALEWVDEALDVISRAGEGAAATWGSGCPARGVEVEGGAASWLLWDTEGNMWTMDRSPCVRWRGRSFSSWTEDGNCRMYVARRGRATTGAVGLHHGKGDR